MPLIPKTSRREHSLKTATAIITSHKDSKLLAQIDDQLTLSPSTVATIIHCHARQPDQPF